jgi:hypothetical protein
MSQVHQQMLRIWLDSRLRGNDESTVWLPPHRNFKSDLFKGKKTAFFKPFFYAPITD